MSLPASPKAGRSGLRGLLERWVMRMRRAADGRLAMREHAQRQQDRLAKPSGLTEAVNTGEHDEGASKPFFLPLSSLRFLPVTATRALWR